MDYMARVEELAKQKGLSLHSLARVCDVPYTTLMSTLARSGQLTVDTIAMVCNGLGITLHEFFTVNDP